MDEEHKVKTFTGPSLMEDAHMGLSREAGWQGNPSLQPYFSGWVGESLSLISSSLQLLLLILVKLQFKIAIPIEHQLGKLGV